MQHCGRKVLGAEGSDSQQKSVVFRKGLLLKPEVTAVSTTLIYNNNCLYIITKILTAHSAVRLN